MTDQELLMLAAKALISRTSQPVPVSWNPQDDDGDALRLAAELQISVLFQVHGVEARNHRTKCIATEGLSYENDDIAAAARRAIVRAAAGKCDSSS
jgi:hypothetical protein